MDKQALALKTNLKFWFKNQVPNKQDYKSALLPIATVDTVQNFWAFYQHFKRPSDFADQWEIFLFKENIQPFWEDPANKQGGAFTLKFKKSQSNKVYEDIILAFVAKNVNEWNLVNGLRFKIRKDVLNVDIWIPHADEAEKVQETKDWILTSLCLNPDTTIQLMKFHFA